MLDKILKDELNKKYEEQIKEADLAPRSLVDTEKVQKESGKENKDNQKEVGKKMDDYVKDMGNEDFVPPANRLTAKQDEYIETHRGGNNMQLEYETEPSEAFKERLAKNAPYGDIEDKGNIYDNIGVTKFKANDTQAKMEKAAKEVARQKGDLDGYYGETGKGIKYADQPVTDGNKKSTEKNNVARLALKENKMKKLKYKKEFIDESHAISLIPNSYKVDEHIFEMTDGNLTVKVKWEGDNTDGDAYVLTSKNETILSEEMNRMKELFGYDGSAKLDKRKNITLDEEQYFLGFHNDVNGFALTSDQVEEEIIDDINVEETEEVVAETTEEVTEEATEEVVTEGDVIGVDAPESKDELEKDEKDHGNVVDEECEIESDGKEVHEDTEGEETDHYGEDEGEDHKEEEDLEHEEKMAPEDHIEAIENHLDALKSDMGYDEDHEDRDEEGTHFAESAELINKSVHPSTIKGDFIKLLEVIPKVMMERFKFEVEKDAIAEWARRYYKTGNRDIKFEEQEQDDFFDHLMKTKKGWKELYESTLKEWCKANDLLSENGNVTLTCVEKAKLSENKLIVKKSILAESIISEKKK